MNYKTFKRVLCTLSRDQKAKIDSLKKSTNIVGFSGGKDSPAVGRKAKHIRLLPTLQITFLQTELSCCRVRWGRQCIA
jgi:tRNA(Ile)-lysidine synthase TilS/MesJ